jgi:hypothetical protein
MRSLGCDSPSAGSNCVLCVVQVLAADKAKSTIRVGAGMRYTEFLKEAQKAGMSVQVRLTRAGIDGSVTVLCIICPNFQAWCARDLLCRGTGLQV